MNVRVQRILSSLSSKPGYTLMRAFARFSSLRILIPKVRSCLHQTRVSRKKDLLNGNVAETLFPDIDIDSVVADLKRDGVAFGLKLPMSVVRGIKSYAERSICYADRNPASGFCLENRQQAEQILGKQVLVAQYFNTLSECEDIARLSTDPVLLQIASKYLQSVPTFVGANLWWTFPVNATKEEQSRHAHLFHRDVDDFRFFKFFFYLTDVDSADGGHICVLGSQGKPPTKHAFDRWNIRRYSDEEIAKEYASEQVREICGLAGVGFAEDTWCIHKGQTPVKNPRLLLQLQFALFDYGAMHDHRDVDVLRKLA